MASASTPAASMPPRQSSSYFSAQLSNLIDEVDKVQDWGDGLHARIGPVASLLKDLESKDTKDRVLLALHEAQAAELAQRNEIRTSHRREEELQQELQSVIQSQSALTDQLDQLRAQLQNERMQATAVRAQLQLLQTAEDEKRELPVAQQEQLQNSLHQQEVLMCKLQVKEKQLTECQTASAAQTAALIDQENAAEQLSEKLVSTQEELQSAHQTIADLHMRLEALPASPTPAEPEHPCTDSTSNLRDQACESELFEFTDIKSELNRIDDQLGALGNENECLRTARNKLQAQLWQIQAENGALKDTVSRLRSHAASTSKLALPHTVRADVLESSPPLQTVPENSCSADTDMIPQQSGFSVDCNASAHSRVLFHWSGMDFSQVACQRDKAMHDMTDMSFELEQARCELRCVHAQLRSALDMEDQMTKAKSQLRMVSLQRARAMAVAQGAAEQLAEVEIVWRQMQQHLHCWQHCNAGAMQHFGADQCCAVQTGDKDCASDVPALMSQLLQGTCEMQKMATTLQEVDVGTALLVTELRELRSSESGYGQCKPAYSPQSCTAEHRRLYQLNCQQSKTIQSLQAAANRSRYSVAAVLGRLVPGTKQQQSHSFLLSVLLSWRVHVAKKILAANAQRLCNADDWATSIQERSIEQASALVQRHTEKREVWLKQTVFNVWNKQLWLARAVQHLWHRLFVIARGHASCSEYQCKKTSMAARQVARKRQHIVVDGSLFSWFASLWTLSSTFLCWKSCTAAAKMEHDALCEMHAVEALSRSLVVSAERTESRQLLHRAWLGWQRRVLSSAMELVQEMKKEGEAAAAQKCTSEMLCQGPITLAHSGANDRRTCVPATSSQPLAHDALSRVRSPGAEAALSHGGSDENNLNHIRNVVHDSPPTTTGEHSKDCSNVVCNDTQQADPVVDHLGIAHYHASVQNVPAVDSGDGPLSVFNSACGGNDDTGHELRDQITQDCRTFEADHQTPQPLQCTVASPTPDKSPSELLDDDSTVMHGSECMPLAAEHADEMLDDLNAHTVPSGAHEVTEPVRCTTTLSVGEDATATEDAIDHSIPMQCEVAILSLPKAGALPVSPAAGQGSTLRANLPRPETSNRMATLPASRSKGRNGAPQAGCAVQQAESTTSCAVDPRSSVIHNRRGCSGMGQWRTAVATNSAACAWKPAGKRSLKDPKVGKSMHLKSPARRREQSSTQVGRTQISRCVKNMKENSTCPRLAPGVDIKELKGCSRMPVLKKWDAHDFAVAQRLGFQLEAHVRGYGQPDDKSETYTWTDAESAIDKQVTSHCSESCRVTNDCEQLCDEQSRMHMLLQGELAGSNCAQQVVSPAKQDTECGEKQGHLLRSTQHHTTPPSPRQPIRETKRSSSRPHTSCSSRRKKGELPDPCAPTPTKRDALLSRFYSEHRRPEKGGLKHAEQCAPGSGFIQSDALQSLANHPNRALSTTTADTAVMHAREPCSGAPGDIQCDAMSRVDTGKQALQDSHGVLFLKNNSMSLLEQQLGSEVGKADCGVVPQPATQEGCVAPCRDEAQDDWDATRQPCIEAINALSNVVEEGQQQIHAVRSMRHSVEKSTLRRLFSVKVTQDENGEPGTAQCSGPIAFQVGDVQRGIVHNTGSGTPWSGYSGKTFSSHVKQAAFHDTRAAARDGVNGLLDPTGDAEVRLGGLTSSAFSPGK